MKENIQILSGGQVVLYGTVHSGNKKKKISSGLSDMKQNVCAQVHNLGIWIKETKGRMELLGGTETTDLFWSVKQN